jgi:hypothetical protein
VLLAVAVVAAELEVVERVGAAFGEWDAMVNM